MDGMNFEEWIKAVKTYSKSLGIDYGELDLEAWRESFSDGSTPEEAVLYDLECGI